MRSLGIAALAALLAASAQGDSLFTQAAQKDGTLIAEAVGRFEVGEIITVLVRERIDANTQADTNTKKESDVQSEANENENQFFVADNPGLNILNSEELPNWDIQAENETKTKGTTKRTSMLTTTVACLVTHVLPNGNLVIEGERRVTVNREDSLLLVRGLARPQDIGPGNTLQSTQLAAASIQLEGKGPLWNNQRRGLFTRFLDWVSPF